MNIHPTDPSTTIYQSQCLHTLASDDDNDNDDRQHLSSGRKRSIRNIKKTQKQSKRAGQKVYRNETRKSSSSATFSPRPGPNLAWPGGE